MSERADIWSHCRCCGEPFVDDDTEGPVDYCQQCRYDLLAALDAEDDDGE